MSASAILFTDAEKVVLRNLMRTFRQVGEAGMLSALQALSRQSYALSERDDEGFLVFRNDSSETIPPYGCMQVTGTEEAHGRNYAIVTKPTDEFGFGGPYLLNSDREVPADAPFDLGTAQLGFSPLALSKLANVSPGGQYRPESGTWKLHEKPGGMFQCLGGDDVSRTDDQVIRICTNYRWDVKTFRAPSGGIAAATNETTLSYATCDWYEHDGTNLVAKTDADSTQITDSIGNMGDEAVAADAYVQAVVIDKGFVCNWEQCGSSS